MPLDFNAQFDECDPQNNQEYNNDLQSENKKLKQEIIQKDATIHDLKQDIKDLQRDLNNKTIIKGFPKKEISNNVGLSEDDLFNVQCNPTFIIN